MLVSAYILFCRLLCVRSFPVFISPFQAALAPEPQLLERASTVLEVGGVDRTKRQQKNVDAVGPTTLLYNGPATLLFSRG